MVDLILRDKSVFIINLPQYEADTVPLGPAIIQSVAKDCGYKTYFQDLNLELDKTKDKNKLLQKVWASNLKGHLPLSSVRQLIQLFDKTISQIISTNCEFVAISFFCMFSMPYGKLFLKRLKTLGCKSRIVIGGPGVSRMLDTVENLRVNKLTDFYVVGDGEVSFQKILENNLPYPGVNNPNSVAIADMDNLPLPDFENFDLPQYPKMYGKPTIGVEGSRGCVRNCGFCDIKVLFQKYRYKSGQRLFDEIMQQVQKHDIKIFWFTDSLVNGNQKEFRNMLSLLADYNDKQLDENKIKWTGQYIIRNKKTYRDNDFDLLKRSGCYTLATGIESYSETVRAELGKNFTNDDIRWFLQQCQDYDIKLFIMMVIGYPTETEEDFQQTIEFFHEFEHLADDNTITGLQLGHTMILIEGTPAWHKQDEYGISYDQFENVSSSNSWKNQNSDLKTRLRRRLIAQKVALEKGFGIRSSQEHLDMFRRWMHG